MRNSEKKFQKWSLLCLVVFMISISLYGCGKTSSDLRSDEAPKVQEYDTDAERIKYEYESYNHVTREDGITIWPVEIPKENPFVYVTLEEAVSLAEEGTGVLFIGSPWCRVCRMDIVLILNALEDKRTENNEYVRQIYYLDVDTIDRESPAYAEFSEKVLQKMHGYIEADDEPYTNIYGTRELIDRKKEMEEEDINDVGKYKYTISFWYDGKLLGMNVGSTSHYVNSDTPPTEADTAEFAERFWELAELLGTDLCDYCKAFVESL